MKTIKIIELLVKIANGEEVPRKIKYEGDEYIFDGYNYISNGHSLGYCYKLDGILNDEVEIIEDKKIKELKKRNVIKGCVNNDVYYEEDYKLCEIGDKVNEIIKVINDKF